MSFEFGPLLRLICSVVSVATSPASLILNLRSRLLDRHNAKQLELIGKNNNNNNASASNPIDSFTSSEFVYRTRHWSHAHANGLAVADMSTCVEKLHVTTKKFQPFDYYCWSRLLMLLFTHV
jgi:hypothetical protein